MATQYKRISITGHKKNVVQAQEILGNHVYSPEYTSRGFLRGGRYSAIVASTVDISDLVNDPRLKLDEQQVHSGTLSFWTDWHISGVMLNYYEKLPGFRDSMVAQGDRDGLTGSIVIYQEPMFTPAGPMPAQGKIEGRIFGQIQGVLGYLNFLSTFEVPVHSRLK